ncbi:MAG TPA: hypothetical protein VNZ62_00375 [Capillimicrobium sp.]|nr:hypothetical protein [Capillimicrobium sp.]
MALDVGIVISLAEHRRTRGRAAFLFDLADPDTYLAAERVERLGADLAWLPARALLPPARTAAHERRARELGLPLVWPRPWRPRLPRAMRVAAHAERHGRAVELVLAATRLAFCGGFDLEDPEVLAEAIAAAGLALGPALDAAGDVTLDPPIHAAGRLLAASGAAPPAVRVGGAVFAGEVRLAEAALALRGRGLVAER